MQNRLKTHKLFDHHQKMLTFFKIQNKFPALSSFLKSFTPLPPTLGSDVTLNWLNFAIFLMLDCARGFRTSTLRMVQMDFWRNSDLFKKKNIFLAQKLTKSEHFYESLKIFIENHLNLFLKSLK